MTRINCVPVEGLADQHLIAEYRELPRVFALARPLSDREVVPTYRMGAGHVLFFYPRTKWLAQRQAAIITECLRRGFAIQHTQAPEPVPDLDGNWVPTAADIRLSLDRLRERFYAKPGWYRYHGTLAPASLYAWEPSA